MSTNETLETADVRMPEGQTIQYVVNGLHKFGFKLPLELKFYDDRLFRYYEEVASRVEYLKIKPGDIMLDIGACVGSWAIPAAVQGAYVYAFEIGGPQISTLLLNMKLNNLSKDQIKIDFVALHSKDNAKLEFDGKMHLCRKTKKSIPVYSTTLDTWVNERRDELPHIDYIKIDVEGAEFEVLRGAYHTLMEFKPKLIIEIHEQEVSNLRYKIEYLLTKELGYKHEHKPPLHDYFY